MLSGLSVVLVYGAISISHGWYLLPNSVLVKGTLLNFSSNSEAALFFVSKIFVFSLREPAPIVIVIGLVLLLITYIRLLRRQNLAVSWDPALTASVITILLILLHLQFASVGAFFRYEGYLFVLGVVVLGVHVQRIRSLLPEGNFAQTGGWAVVLGAILVLLTWRSSFGLLNVNLAMKNNYDQQYQMARFITKYYENSRVALNDIGAVNFYADIHLLDTAGLGDKEVSDLILVNRAGKFEGAMMHDVAAKRQIQIAVVADSVKVPPEWQLVGLWTLPDGFIVASSTVGFYAVTPEVRETLQANFQAFTPELPVGVQVKINN